MYRCFILSAATPRYCRTKHYACFACHRTRHAAAPLEFQTSRQTAPAPLVHALSGSDCNLSSDAEMEPGRPDHRSPGRRVNILGRVRSGHGSVSNTHDPIRGYKNVLSVRLSTVSILAAKQKLQTKCWDSFRDIVDDSSMVLLAVVFAIPAFFTRRRKVEEWLMFEPRI